MAEFIDDSDEAVERVLALDKQGDSESFFDRINNAQVKPSDPGEFGMAVDDWVMNIPRNIGAGLYRGAINTLDLVDDAMQAANQAAVQGLVDASAEGENKKPKEVKPLPNPISSNFPEFFEASNALADEWEADNTLSDDLTQGIAQFAIPFSGYLRALGGMKNAKFIQKIGRGLTAEAAATGSVFIPQEGRFADLAKLAEHSEGKLGEVFNKIAPDGSLVNAYLNYMTDRQGEGRFDGRVKNIVDGVVGTAVFSPLIIAAAGILKGGRRAFQKRRAKAMERPAVGEVKKNPLGVKELDEPEVLPTPNEARESKLLQVEQQVKGK